MQAVALAQGELACLQAAAAQQTLTAGQYAWLGEPAWLEAGGCTFTVQAEVTPQAEGTWQVNVRVDWQGRGTAGKFTAQSEVVPHAPS